MTELKKLINKISKYETVICSFDRTLVQLNMDLVGFQNVCSKTCREKHILWEIDKSINENLKDIKEINRDLWFDLIVENSKIELSGFNETTTNLQLVELLKEKPNVGIFSSKTSQAINKIFENSLFEGLNPVVMGKEDVNQQKPSPEGLLKIIKYFKVDSSEVLFIGHSGDSMISKEANCDFFNIEGTSF